MKRGQFSLEFLIVLGVLVTILGTVTMPLYRSSKEDTQQITRLTQVKEAANKLSQGLNTVSSGAVGAKNTVKYSLPQQVEKIQIHPSGDRISVRIDMTWGENVQTDTLLSSDTTIENKNLSEDHDNYTVVLTHEGPDETHENSWIRMQEV